MNNKINIGYESPETLRLAMAFQVKSKAGKTLLGKEDWGGLEGPADVVAVAVDHADEGTWRGGGEGKP